MADSKQKERKRAAADELAALYPAARSVNVRVNTAEAGQSAAYGETIIVNVEEFDITQVAKVGKVLHGALTDTASLDSAGVMEFAVDHADELIELVAIAVAQPKTRVQRFAASDFMELAFTVYEVNRDFFVRRLGSRAAAVSAMVSRMLQQPMVTTAPTAKANGDGRMPSHSSASTDESSIPNG